MDVALCTVDNTRYTSEQFSQLNFSELSEKRRHLVCPECGGPAFFRRQTRDGRIACFGARPHQPNCAFSVLDEARIFQDPREVAEIILNPEEWIVLDLNFGAPQDVHGAKNIGQDRIEERAAILFSDNAVNNNRVYRRLSSLLRTLTESTYFRFSPQVLEVLGQKMQVKDFFVPLLEIDSRHLNRLRGFWGMLSDIGVGQPGTVWLNSGGRSDISFCLDYQSFLRVCQRFSIADEEDFSGVYALIIGEAKLSQNGKIYCVIENQDMICLRTN